MALPGPRRFRMPCRGHWADRLAPAGLRPYLRLARIERPIGWWLLLLPCWWSAALAAIAGGQPWPNRSIALLFLIGAVAMRGAGCTYNDIVDRDLDMKVERTRQRPLPSGQVSLKGALAFSSCWPHRPGGAAAVQWLRHRHRLGLARDRRALSLHEALLLDAADRPRLRLCLGRPDGMGRGFRFAGAAPAFLLYAGSIAWVVGYDTIYALQDIEDDEIVGIKSSARFFGEQVRIGVAACYAITVVCLTGALYLAGAGLAGFSGLCAFCEPSWMADRSHRQG